MPNTRKVTTIPATLNRYTSIPITENTKKRVAGYARVSTDHDDQFTSYEAQIDYYTKYIKRHIDWEFVDVYTDEGITGTNRKRRKGFNSMMEDALAGRIDLIVTKSVSRFARNTVDSLTAYRQLKASGVEVFFEKENISTFDPKCELILTIMASLAQEESRSISENCTWGQRKRFADGKVSVAFTRFLGYDRGLDGNLVVNHEQAQIIKRIYAMFLQGMGYRNIARKLEKDHILAPGGKEKWYMTTVKGILTNEKYKGDALLQKSYTVDFLTKKTKKNEGEIPQYYVEGNHEAIIPPDVFDLIQSEIEKRSNSKNYHSTVHAFSSKIKCGECGAFYGSKVWHSTSKYRKVVWRCNRKYDNDHQCSTPHLTEQETKDLFVKSVNKLLKDKEEIIENINEAIDLIFDPTELLEKKQELTDETIFITEMVDKVIKENSRIAQHQNERNKKYNSLVERYNKAKKQLDEVSDELNDKETRRADLMLFIKDLHKTPDIIKEFDLNLWNTLVEYATVYSSDDIWITFKNGQEIKA